MVNWLDPSLVLNDYLAFIKLNHAMAGIYIWEIVLTAGFELDVLRRKRPYRWTIWLYLGTRYTGLFSFICFFIDVDGPRVDCHPFMIANFAFPYTCWAFASLIIVLRVIAIWNRNMVVSLIAVGVWLGGLILHIRNLIMVSSLYNPVADTCVILHTRRGLVNALAMLVIDVVLLVAMLIGLLRHVHGKSGGMWKFLYQQCIIWLAVALIAEIPPVVFLSLNLNDVWNEMLLGPAIAILSIAAARMYRSLSDRGSFTEYESSRPLRFPSASSNPTTQCRGATGKVHSHICFASAIQSEETRTTSSAPAFLPVDQILVEFVPGGSGSNITKEKIQDNANPTVYETV